MENETTDDAHIIAYDPKAWKNLIIPCMKITLTSEGAVLVSQDAYEWFSNFDTITFEGEMGSVKFKREK